MNRFWISREWIRARTVSTPGRDARRDSVLLLTHIDGQTGLNIPEIHEQELGSTFTASFFGCKSFMSERKPVWKEQPFSASGRNVWFSSPTVSPSFHGVEEANPIRWTTDLDQIFPAHPQEVSAYKESSRRSATALQEAETMESIHRGSIADSYFGIFTGPLDPRNLCSLNLNNSSAS